MALSPSSLSNELLYLILYGPGYGESVAVRVPGNHWLVVDSFRYSSSGEYRVPTLDLVKGAGTLPEVIALTHTHGDHAAGFELLVEESAADSIVGCLEPLVKPSESTATRDPIQTIRAATVLVALEAVQDAWDSEDRGSWNLVASESVRLGPAIVESLSPEKTEVERVVKKSRPRWNDLSSAMLVSWESTSVLLGADLEKRGWDKVASRYPTVPLAAGPVFKVSHHGSEGAVHPVAYGAAEADKDRIFLLTPWHLAGNSLPDFAPDGGVDKLRERSSRILLTGPPPSSKPTKRFGRFTMQGSTDSAPERDAWALIGIDGNGVVVDQRAGSGGKWL